MGRLAFLTVSLIGLGACFTGGFLDGQPCQSDADCGPKLACEAGYCGGRPPGLSSSTTFVPTTDPTTTAPSTTDASTSTGFDPTTTTGTTMMIDPTTGSSSTGDNTTGPGCGYGRCADIDLVVIVDNSPSMNDKESAMLQALVSFQVNIQPELEQACSLHMAVMTTDIAYPFNPVECQKPGALVQRNFNGEECMTAEGHPYATLADIDNPVPLLCLIQVGALGADDERPVEMMFEMFNPTVNGADKCNEGFIRKDSQLMVVLATDEDDDKNDAQGHSGSLQPASIWYDGLVALKPEEDMLMIGLLGDDDQSMTDCAWDPTMTMMYPDGKGAEPATNLKAQLFNKFSEEHRAIGPLCVPQQDGIYDPLIMEIRDKLRAMCEVE
jgi:hypothetical protein